MNNHCDPSEFAVLLLHMWIRRDCHDTRKINKKICSFCYTSVHPDIRYICRSGSHELLQIMNQASSVIHRLLLDTEYDEDTLVIPIEHMAIKPERFASLYRLVERYIKTVQQLQDSKSCLLMFQYIHRLLTEYITCNKRVDYISKHYINKLLVANTDEEIASCIKSLHTQWSLKRLKTNAICVAPYIRNTGFLDRFRGLSIKSDYYNSYYHTLGITNDTWALIQSVLCSLIGTKKWNESSISNVIRDLPLDALTKANILTWVKELKKYGSLQKEVVRCTFRIQQNEIKRMLGTLEAFPEIKIMIRHKMFPLFPSSKALGSGLIRLSAYESIALRSSRLPYTITRDILVHGLNVLGYMRATFQMIYQHVPALAYIRPNTNDTPQVMLNKWIDQLSSADPTELTKRHRYAPWSFSLRASVHILMASTRDSPESFKTVGLPNIIRMLEERLIAWICVSCLGHKNWTGRSINMYKCIVFSETITEQQITETMHWIERMIPQTHKKMFHKHRNAIKRMIFKQHMFQTFQFSFLRRIYTRNMYATDRKSRYVLLEHLLGPNRAKTIEPLLHRWRKYNPNDLLNCSGFFAQAARGDTIMGQHTNPNQIILSRDLWHDDNKTSEFVARYNEQDQHYMMTITRMQNERARVCNVKNQTTNRVRKIMEKTAWITWGDVQSIKTPLDIKQLKETKTKHVIITPEQILFECNVGSGSQHRFYLNKMKKTIKTFKTLYKKRKQWSIQM